MAIKSNKEEFLQKLKFKRQDKGEYYDYSQFVYINNHTPGIIICQLHGPFPQSPSNHMKDQQCPHCVVKSKPKEKEFYEKANLIHNNKYDYSQFVYINCKIKGIILCPLHGPFPQTPDNHLQGKGCHKCAIIESGLNKRLSLEEFIQKSNDIHKNKYDYSLVNYINNSTEIKIICPIHTIFTQTPSSHLSGHGCNLCAMNMRIQTHPKTTETFIKEAKETHGDKYDYSLVDYINAHTKVIIICPFHEQFPQTPASHLQGIGCPKCSKTHKKTKEEFIIEANKKHNNFYNYSLVDFIDMNTQVTIICSLHKPFSQLPSKHLKGQGCPKCRGSISKAESKFLNHINIPDTKENRQVKIGKKKVDGYDLENKIIYEFLGDYFHGNPEIYDENEYNETCHTTHGNLYKKTTERFFYFKSLGYVVKYIWENDWKRYLKGLDNEPKILIY